MTEKPYIQIYSKGKEISKPNDSHVVTRVKVKHGPDFLITELPNGKFALSRDYNVNMSRDEAIAVCNALVDVIEKSRG